MHQSGARENLQGACGKALNLGKYKLGKRESQPYRKDQRETVPSMVSQHATLPSQEGKEKKITTVRNVMKLSKAYEISTRDWDPHVTHLFVL